MLAIIGLGGDQRKQTEWLNPAFGSFDDFGHAMLILYIISTGDMWEEFMWAGMDAKAVDVAPERNDYSWISVYFLAWVVIGSFVSINLFVGAITDNFTRIKQTLESEGADGGSATMTADQRAWAETMQSFMDAPGHDAKNREPMWEPRRSINRFVRLRSFEFFVRSPHVPATRSSRVDMLHWHPMHCVSGSQVYNPLAYRLSTCNAGHGSGCGQCDRHGPRVSRL